MPNFAATLDNDLVTVVDADYALSTFRLQIGDIKTVVTIRIGRRPTSNGRYEYTTSHVIRTPEQLGPYYSSVPYGDSREGALAKAIDDFTVFYLAARRAGHMPAESWLVPKASFE